MGQVVLLNGEAGIGKSRLVQALKERLASEQYTRLECRCSAYHQNSPLYPVIDLYQRALQLRREDSSDVRLEKLERALAQLSVPLPDVVPLLASLLSVPFVDRYPALSLTPQQQKRKTLDALLAVLMALTTQKPVLFILEDLHWIDPSTIELLELLIDQGPVARILTLLTCRPDFRQPWGFRSHVTSLTLSRLPRTQTELMIDRVTGGKALPTVVREQVVTKTDGVPLFVEEFTKTLLESGFLQDQEDRYELTGPLPPLAIPATLHDSLVARLDRLAPVKEVAQLGATLGRAFPYELLQAVGPWDEATLQHALARLVEAELLYQQGMPPQATYLFKHALIQEAAYQSLLRSRRQQYHSHIAQVLEEQFPEIAEAQPELLAHHYTEAGLSAQAIPHWQRAGRRAIQRSANIEAISHLTNGLELLKTLPQNRERAEQELDLQTTLGPALMATRGYAAPEVEVAYSRARDLCRQIGETPKHFPVLWGLWLFYFVRAELHTARELGQQLLTLAQSLQELAFLLEAHRALGTTLLFLGELGDAQEHLEQAIGLYDPQQHRSLTFLYGQDPKVTCLCYAAWILWLLGYPDRALTRSHEGLTLAQELGHPFSLVFALNWTAIVHRFRREEQETQRRAEAVLALSREHGFAQRLATGTILQGWVLAQQHSRLTQGPEGCEEAVAQMSQGLAAFRATGAEVGGPQYLTLLAEALAKKGEAEAALHVLAEALAAMRKSGERWWEAELYRLKGEMMLEHHGEHHMEAEACFWQAVDTARRQQAKSLELRAAMSLSRLWQQEGKQAEARELLAPIYGWFTEGFDTADLREAKALLDELS
jgi:predicted ATPase